MRPQKTARILLGAACSRVAEERDNGVADVFVDRRPVVEGDLRHLGQIVVQEVGQLLGLQAVSGPCEIGDVGEEDGQLLALRGDLDRLLAREGANLKLTRCGLMVADTVARNVLRP